MLIRHRNPVEEGFILWMNEYPESSHTLDMKRFYIFVKSVYVYHAKSWTRYSYFREQIKKKNPKFSEDNIELFYDKLCTGLAALKSRKIPLLESDDSIESGTKERIVRNGEIIERLIKK